MAEKQNGASGMRQDTERDNAHLVTGKTVKTETNVTNTDMSRYTTASAPAPYTIPSDPSAIDMRRLGQLIWRMHNTVPMDGKGSALLADIMQAVGMMPDDGMLYTSEVCEEIERHRSPSTHPIPDDTFTPANDAERLFGVPAGYGDTSERDDRHDPYCTCAGCRGDEPDEPECPPPPSFGKCDLCKKETSDLKQCSKCDAWCCYMDWMRQDGGTVLCVHCDFEQAYGEAWQ